MKPDMEKIIEVLISLLEEQEKVEICQRNMSILMITE